MARKKKSFLRGTLYILIIIIIASAAALFYQSKGFNYNTASLREKAALFSHKILKENAGKQKISFDEINGTTAKYDIQKEEYIVESNYYLISKKGETLKYAYFMYIKYHPKLNYWEKLALDSYRMN